MKIFETENSKLQHLLALICREIVVFVIMQVHPQNIVCLLNNNYIRNYIESHCDLG